MQQKFNFDEQVQTFAVQLISALSALAPIIIILSMLGAFAWLGFMDYLYFEKTLPASSMAVLAAIFLQSMRFGTALGSVRMFRQGKIAGVLFLAASLLLTYLESAHVVQVAGTLSDNQAGQSANVWLIRIAVWSSVGLELLVAVLFNSMYSENASKGLENSHTTTLETITAHQAGTPGDELHTTPSKIRSANFTLAPNGQK